jgi:flavin reductase (DIM6/NTAB) family NADH-FMN oxidoreductase RutF
LCTEFRIPFIPCHTLFSYRVIRGGFPRRDEEIEDTVSTKEAVMKVKIPLRQSNRLLNHGPVVLISCCIENDRYNCLPVAWTMPVRHEPPVVAVVIGKGNYSYTWIRKNGEFVINIPPATMLPVIVECGSVTGAEVDKFERFKLVPSPADTVRAPLIEQCIGHLECKVIYEKKMMDTYNIFIANVTSAWAEKTAFDEIWKLKKDEQRTIHHLGGNNFVIDGQVKKIS